MAKRCNRILLHFLFFFVSVANAQETTVVGGWKYIPQNRKVFETVNDLISQKNIYDAINLLYKIINDKKEDDLSRVEAKLFMAEALIEIDLKSLAVEYFKEIIKGYPGTFMSQKALLQLSNILPEVPTYEKDIRYLLNRGAFKEVPAPASSMIQYFVALDNFSKGEIKWAFDSIKYVEPNSYWGQNLEFFRAIEFVKKSDFKSAEEVLSRLIESDGIHAVIKRKSILQRARIYFETKSFDKAEQDYLKYDSQGRDTGRVLYERALVSFYQKKYAHALGLLESLKSENFKTAFNPEQVILEMMIYRELCHYPTVKRIASEFESKYRFLLSYFKSGQDFSKSQIVKRIIFQNIRIKESADLINRMRVEMKDLKIKHSSLDSSIRKKMITDLEVFEKNYRENIEREIKPLLKPTAINFVNKAEEIRLLEYVSGLDEFRIKNLFESREYKSQNPERNQNYNVLYWPVGKEYWWGEYKNYQVLLGDRCAGVSTGKEGGK